MRRQTAKLETVLAATAAGAAAGAVTAAVRAFSDSTGLDIPSSPIAYAASSSDDGSAAGSGGSDDDDDGGASDEDVAARVRVLSPFKEREASTQ